MGQVIEVFGAAEETNLLPWVIGVAGVLLMALLGGPSSNDDDDSTPGGGIMQPVA